MSRLQSPRGTLDLLPEQTDLWHRVEQIAERHLSLAGFREIRTPIFEHTEVFQRSVGEGSDIVRKEMYTFSDRSDRSLTLRPEGTAGVVRALLSNGMDRLPKPLRLWYYGPMFRYERSQTGRFRQFTQLGAEMFGSSSIYAELECIMLAHNIVSSVIGSSDVTVELHTNSLGDVESRGRYTEALRGYLQSHAQHLCPDCQSRMHSNPLRALDCKVPADQALYRESAPNIAEYLSDTAQSSYRHLSELLCGNGVRHVHDNRLVRGLDYYTHTVFELKVTNSQLGNQNTICAGGRYDGLVAEFGGPQMSAFGWAIGMERLLHLVGGSEVACTGVFLVNDGISCEQLYSIAQTVRSAGICAVFDYEGRPYQKQFEQAKKSGYQIVSVSADSVVQHMSDGSRQTYSTIGGLLGTWLTT